MATKTQNINDPNYFSVNPNHSENPWLDKDDPYNGMMTAVFNGQNRLALEHAVLVIQGLRENIDDIQSKLELIEASLASSRKITKKPTEPEPQPDKSE